jgi:preprotein translocase subunit YajC
MPSRKKQKELAATIDALKKGDRVITTGGIFGEVVSVDTATLVMKIGDNVKIKVSKSAIGGLQGDPAAEASG